MIHGQRPENVGRRASLLGRTDIDDRVAWGDGLAVDAADFADGEIVEPDGAFPEKT